MLSQFPGFKMIESEHALKKDVGMGRYVKRSWKERLFSRPWTPFRKDKLIIVARYTPVAFRVYDTIVYHPSLKKRLEELLKNAA